MVGRIASRGRGVSCRASCGGLRAMPRVDGVVCSHDSAGALSRNRSGGDGISPGPCHLPPPRPPQRSGWLFRTTALHRRPRHRRPTRSRATNEAPLRPQHQLLNRYPAPAPPPASASAIRPQEEKAKLAESTSNEARQRTDRSASREFTDLQARAAAPPVPQAEVSAPAPAAPPAASAAAPTAAAAAAEQGGGRQ
jgi:hypothetical protein